MRRSFTRPRAAARSRIFAGIAGIAGLLLAAGLFGACERAPQRFIRLGSLVAVEKSAPVVLPAGTATVDEPYRIDAGLNAARVARLRLRSRGDARMATFAWKLAGDRGFPPYRTLSFPVAPDGLEHAYEIDLQREPYWAGRVETVRFGVDAGRLEILGLTAEPPGTPYRSMSLKGESHPSLPGLGRIEVALPAGLPSGTRFEAQLGLVPEYDKPGVEAAFSAYWEHGGRRDLWLQQTLAGGSAAAGWRGVSREIPGREGRLALEVAATRHGEPLPEGVALWGDPALVTPGRKAGKNLIVVLIDTLRADALGAYGSRDGLTPALDRFAAQGIKFGEMLSPSSWTLPSVASLMTGLQPQTHGAGIRYGEFAPTGLTGGVRTLAEVLRGQGFYTFGVYHNIYVNPAFGLQQGFDEYVSLEEGAQELVDTALGRLRRYSRDRRFFLYLHLFDLHTPYQPPDEECRTVSRRFAPGYPGPFVCLGDRRPELPTPPPAERRWDEALYRGELAYTDRQIGRFLAGLHDLGLDGDTVVAIVSDHGEEFWTRFDREKELGYEANGDHGHTLYQELVHVPALLRDPGRAPGLPRTIAGPVQTVDLFPTLLHLAGVEPPPSQGRDLTPRLNGANGAPPDRPLLLADVILHGPPRWSVRRGPWKLIVPRDAGPPLELYDLEHDPGELHDVAALHPDVVAGLRNLGERELAQRKKDRARYLAGQDTLGATYLEWNHITKLRALGYLK